MIDQPMAYELRQFIDNDANLYRQQYTPIVKNLALKKAKGIYVHAKAVKLFRQLVDNADKMYHSGASSPWATRGQRVQSDTATRNHVADELAKTFEEEYDLGNYSGLLPKKYQQKANPNVKLPRQWTPGKVRVDPKGQIQVMLTGTAAKRAMNPRDIAFRLRSGKRQAKRRRH